MSKKDRERNYSWQLDLKRAFEKNGMIIHHQYPLLFRFQYSLDKDD